MTRLGSLKRGAFRLIMLRMGRASGTRPTPSPAGQRLPDRRGQRGGHPGRSPRHLVGPARHWVSNVGGMHHAIAARASGFGVYNDVATAVA